MYSHHLIPQFIWAAVVFLIGKVLFKSTTIGLAAMALFVSHIILDFFSGHGHHLFGANTVAIGLGLYAKNAYLAILIEALFMSLLLHIISGSRRTRVSFVPIKAAQLSSGFSLMVSFSCCRSPRFLFRDLLGIPAFNFAFNTTVPTIMLTYIALAAVLCWVVPKIVKV